MTFLTLWLLWPLIKWLIIIVVILILILYLTLRKKTKVFSVRWNDLDQDRYDNNYETRSDDRIQDDVIDVEYTKKDIDE